MTDSLIATRITTTVIAAPGLHTTLLTTIFCIYCIFGSSPADRGPSGTLVVAPPGGLLHRAGGGCYLVLW